MHSAEVVYQITSASLLMRSSGLHCVSQQRSDVLQFKFSSEISSFSASHEERIYYSVRSSKYRLIIVEPRTSGFLSSWWV